MTIRTKRGRRPTYAELERLLEEALAKPDPRLQLGQVNGRDVGTAVAEALGQAVNQRELRAKLEHMDRVIEDARIKLAHANAQLEFARAQFGAVIAALMRRFRLMRLEITGEELKPPTDLMLAGEPFGEGGLVYEFRPYELPKSEHEVHEGPEGGAGGKADP